MLERVTSASLKSPVVLVCVKIGHKGPVGARGGVPTGWSLQKRDGGVEKQFIIESRKKGTVDFCLVRKGNQDLLVGKIV